MSPYSFIYDRAIQDAQEEMKKRYPDFDNMSENHRREYAMELYNLAHIKFCEYIDKPTKEIK